MLLAQATRAPGQAAAGATRTARAPYAGNDPEAEPAASAAAATVAATATMETTATSAATAAVAAAATMTTTASAGQLHAAAANVFLVEEIERGETDVGHFFFAKNEALIGLIIVR